MAPEKQWLRLAARCAPYGALVLLVAAVAVPNFVAARWESAGVPVMLDLTVRDARDGQPVPGAEARLLWRTNDLGLGLADATSLGSATTDTNGRCVLMSSFPGGGTGQTGRLRVGRFLHVRAPSHPPLITSLAEALGPTLAITNGPSVTNRFAITLSLPRP
jgi:hypothetical protein